MKFKLAKLFSYNKGFTLIEVMLSIVILSVLTLGMLTLFSQAMNYTQKSENDTLGVYAARNMLNYMEQQDFTEIKTKYIDNLKEEGKDSSVVLTAEICKDWFKGNNEDVLKRKARCEYTFKPNINNRTFTVNVELQKHANESLHSSLIPIKIQVQWEEKNESFLEGFIANEKLR